MTTKETPPAIQTAVNAAPDGWWASWWSRIPAHVADAAVTVVTVVVAMVLLVISEEPDRQAPDAVGHVLLVGAAAPYLVRRRWPAATVMATAATALVYLVLAYPGGPVTVPVLVALYGAAAQGRRMPALAVVVFFVGVGSAHRLVVQEEPFIAVAFQGLLYVFAWLLGELVSSRVALRAEVDARLRRAVEEREREAARRVQQERVQIARELHDVLAHTVTSMTVQAGVAADLLDDRPEEARRALALMRHAGRDAMTEPRATVSLLRTGDHGSPRLPAPGLADLDGLVERITRDGLSVEHVVVGEPRAVPAAVGLTGYRIVQEALTNAVRHAGAGHAIVRISYDPDGLTIQITDDGRGGNHVLPGFGLLGMRERVEAVGGRLEAAPCAGGGFRVRARLPTGEPAR